jgi:hypothetical protein
LKKRKGPTVVAKRENTKVVSMKRRPTIKTKRERKKERKG